MTQDVSSKNTKAQILDAYEELLEQVAKAKSNVPKQVQEEKQRKETVVKVNDVSNKGIVNEINSLRANLNNSLENLEANLVSEFKKLEEIRAAIAIEKQSLEDLYSLSSTTDSLAAMLLTQKQEKENFEVDMKQKKEDFENEILSIKEAWKLEKEKQKDEQKDFLEHIEKSRTREKEEYQYNLKIVRQKENDEYQVKKSKIDKELTDRKLSFNQEIEKREADITNAEAELIDLRKNNEKFPKELEKELANKKKEITERLTSLFEFESKLLAKQNEGELKLKDQTIGSLTEKISDIEKRTKELTDKANLAESNVKDIAVKAIESSSKIQVFPTKEKDES